MLRQTQSAIVFVQQLGRGLRKLAGKDYLVVIDFIGNYANNFLIPIALFGDESLNKESLKQHLIAAEEAGVLPGLASVRFDRDLPRTSTQVDRDGAARQHAQPEERDRDSAESPGQGARALGLPTIRLG